MTGMFTSASVFNVDISKWNVSSVESMNHMFLDAPAFNQQLCGAAWINSKASKSDMFTGSSGSISWKACTPATTLVTPQASREHVSPQPIPERELIVRTPFSTPFITSGIDRAIKCLRCGVFGRSGRASCCAPGGAWFKNCGGRGGKSVDHMWSDGVKACTRKFADNKM